MEAARLKQSAAPALEPLSPAYAPNLPPGVGGGVCPPPRARGAVRVRAVGAPTARVIAGRVSPLSDASRGAGSLRGPIPLSPAQHPPPWGNHNLFQVIKRFLRLSPKGEPAAVNWLSLLNNLIGGLCGHQRDWAGERGCPGPGSTGTPAEGPQPFDWMGRLVWV